MTRALSTQRPETERWPLSSVIEHRHGIYLRRENPELVAKVRRIKRERFDAADGFVKISSDKDSQHV